MLPIVGVINESQSDQLGNIQEESDKDSDQDYDATEKPQAMAKNSDSKYITTNYTNQSEETTAITQNSDSIEYSNMHVPNSLEGERKYLEKITELYKIEYGNDENEIKNRIQHNFKNESLEVKKIAQGGEAIVFRLEHQGTNEVVIKTSLKIQNLTKVVRMSSHKIQFQKKDGNSESPFIDLMEETRHLRLLQSEKYIASVKEEIREWSYFQSKTFIYCVIVEKAKYSLKDLFKLWRTKDLRDKFLENYSPEKLAYYFYQSLQIMAYLHQRNVYYGDMKPHNLLVFRDQQVKVGDLGISIKLDQSRDDNEKLYTLKGLTTAFASTDMLKAFQKRKKLSKKELFEFDKFSLIRTFQYCIQETKYIPIQSQFHKLCDDMVEDLIGNSLQDVLRKYS
eukprot:403340674